MTGESHGFRTSVYLGEPAWCCPVGCCWCSCRAGGGRPPFIAGWLIPAILAVAYVALFIGYFNSAPAGFDAFGSLAGVKSLFQFDPLLLAGWIHYLCFDLFIGSVGSARLHGDWESTICWSFPAWCSRSCSDRPACWATSSCGWRLRQRASVEEVAADAVVAGVSSIVAIRCLSRVGWLHVALLAVMLVAMAFDARQVLGINVWIKPSKFAASIAIYVWTLAWFMPICAGQAGPGSSCVGAFRWRWSSRLPASPGSRCAARPRTSTMPRPWTKPCSAVMGLMIMFNTLLEGWCWRCSCGRCRRWRPHTCGEFGWDWRARSCRRRVGGAMIAHGGHTVGAADGGPGLWPVNWSTQAGDLRHRTPSVCTPCRYCRWPDTVSADVLGHANSVLAARRWRLLVYFAIFAATFVEAVQGRPLVGDGPSSRRTEQARRRSRRQARALSCRALGLSRFPAPRYNARMAEPLLTIRDVHKRYGQIESHWPA